jgi:CelD/BcsL family acetyltransferase involved in cellulose biosynthesis
MSAPTMMRVFIPLTIRKRNGRPKIMPPADLAPDYNDKAVDPHILRAIAKAWSWRRKLDSGQVATIQDIATAEDVTAVYVGRVLKLAYLAPTVLENILIVHMPSSVSLKDMSAVADVPWGRQKSMIFCLE